MLYQGGSNIFITVKQKKQYRALKKLMYEDSQKPVPLPEVKKHLDFFSFLKKFPLYVLYYKWRCVFKILNSKCFWHNFFKVFLDTALDGLFVYLLLYTKGKSKRSLEIYWHLKHGEIKVLPYCYNLTNHYELIIKLAFSHWSFEGHIATETNHVLCLPSCVFITEFL